MHIYHFQALDTECEVRFPSKLYPFDKARRFSSLVQGECLRYERLFSAFRKTSDIGRVNNARGQETAVSPETAELVAKSLDFCTRYPSVFDISIGAASRLWDFHTGRQRKPTIQEAQRASKHTSFVNVHVDLNANTVTIADPDSHIDLGASAKGFIADKICKLLVENGVTSGILNLGGTISLLGENPEGRPWIGNIADPREGFALAKPPLMRFRAKNLSISTSSVILRAFNDESGLMHHILDPKTGTPRQTDLSSASVMSTSAFKADCVSTIALALGMGDAQNALAQEGVQGVLLGKDGTLYVSPGLRGGN